MTECLRFYRCPRSYNDNSERVVQIEQFAGTNVDGAVQISEAALNDLLNSEGSPLRGATIAVGPRNEVLFRYGVLRARVTLPAGVDVGATPRVRLVLASFVVALAVSAAVRLPYIRVNGREVTVLLDEVPALEPFRHLWPHVRSAGLRTLPGAVQAEFRFAVME